jgi:hypothetical protein
MIANKQERSQEEVRVNTHMKGQKIIQELIQKVKNLSMYIKHYLDQDAVLPSPIVPANDKARILDKLNELEKTAENWPFDFMIFVNMGLMPFYDATNKKFNGEFLEKMLPQIKESVKHFPGGDSIQWVDVTTFPSEVKEKVYRYLEYFCGVAVAGTKKP